MERPQADAAAPPGATRAFDAAMARLSATQRAAVEHPGLPLCIVAGAGSGKTSVLTLRAAHRIRRGTAEADHTLVCTFTRKAAAELRERLAGFGVPVSRPGPGRVPTPGVRAGTLHQLALTLIRRHCLDHDRRLPLLVEHRTALLRPVAEGPAGAAVLAAEISWAKARGLSPDAYEAVLRAGRRHLALPADAAVAGFRAYQAALARRDALDLDDLPVRAAELLSGDAAFAERMRWRYRHLAVDEFQDVNPAQFGLLAALLGEGRDLCVVGDPHQAIYGWNGADPTLLDRLPDLLGPVDVLALADNHRSTPQVVAAADAALGPHRRYTARSAVPDGPPPSVAAHEDEWDEAAGVAALLHDRRAEGVPWRQQAVLARTHDQLSVVARVLERSGIPHRRSTEQDGGRGARLNEVGLDGSPEDGESGFDAVELATFHRAKGAEWTAVCVTGVEEGFVPIVYATGEAALAEERRLLYVALTRASRFLHCTWARRRTMGQGRVVERQPSPWLPVGRAAPDGPGPADGRVSGDGLSDRLAGLRAALGGSQVVPPARSGARRAARRAGSAGARRPRPGP